MSTRPQTNSTSTRASLGLSGQAALWARHQSTGSEQMPEQGHRIARQPPLGPLSPATWDGGSLALPQLRILQCDSGNDRLCPRQEPCRLQYNSLTCLRDAMLPVVTDPPLDCAGKRPVGSGCFRNGAKMAAFAAGSTRLGSDADGAAGFASGFTLAKRENV